MEWDILLLRRGLDEVSNICRALERVHASYKGEDGPWVVDERFVSSFIFPFTPSIRSDL